MPHIIILSIAVGAASAGGGVLLTVDVLLSENMYRQYELTPVKSTTVRIFDNHTQTHFGTIPHTHAFHHRTKERCCGTYSRGRGGLLLPENERESDLARRNDVDSAK